MAPPLVRVVDLSADPRGQRWAYITDEKRLGEVVGLKGDHVIIENVADPDEVWQIAGWRVLGDWRLVKAAPAASEAV